MYYVNKQNKKNNIIFLTKGRLIIIVCSYFFGIFMIFILFAMSMLSHHDEHRISSSEVFISNKIFVACRESLSISAVIWQQYVIHEIYLHSLKTCVTEIIPKVKFKS